MWLRRRLKVTVPVGVPPLPVTVAVNVTGCPNVLEGDDEVSAVVELAWLTVCVSIAEVLPSKLLSPP